MPDATTAPALLPLTERSQLLADTDAALQDLFRQIEQLNEQVRPLVDLREEIQRANDSDIINSHVPSDVFDDPELLRVVADREWNDGRGSRPLARFLTTAFVQLAPGICGFERGVSDDYTTVTHLMPRLHLNRGQDVAELAAALQRVHPALAVDAVMKVDILDHTCGENGAWHLEVAGDMSATLYRNGYEERSGDLQEILDHVARNHWGASSSN